MAKKTKRNSKDDGVKALAIAAMKRAIASLEASMGNKSTKPAEGAYPVELTLDIEGDITVGAAVPAGPLTTVPALNAAEILAGLILGHKRPAHRRHLLEVGIAFAEAAKRGETAATIDSYRDACDELVLSVCEELNATTRKRSPARAGAIAGKPTVRVSGTQGTRTLTLEVDAA